MSTEIESDQPFGVNAVHWRLNQQRDQLLTCAAEIARDLTLTDPAEQDAENYRCRLTDLWKDSEGALTITLDELRQLDEITLAQYGFTYEGRDELLLIPLWCWPLIADGAVLYTPQGTSHTKGEDAFDLDTQPGGDCVRYGFYLDPIRTPGSSQAPTSTAETLRRSLDHLLDTLKRNANGD